jgi:hypothetical protein
MKAHPNGTRPVLTGDDVARVVERAAQSHKRVVQGAVYVPESDTLLIVSYPFAVFIERKRIPELHRLDPAALDTIKISPAGTTIIIENQNIYIEAAGLIAAAINAHCR